MITFLTFSAENFRALSSIDLSFENYDSKPLTVIRAENESGKTTLLTALTWTVFGDSSLPGGTSRNSSFRMSPINWDASELGSDVRVITELRVLVSGEEASAFGGTPTEIMIRRRANEKIVDGNGFKRPKSSVRLYSATDQGDVEIKSGDSILNQLFPPYLRDVFFTDGDRALNFIDSSVTQRDRRSRVENSIRTLLGLELLDSARLHVQSAGRALNRSLQGMQDFGDAAQLAKDIEVLEKKIDSTTELLEKAEEEEKVAKQELQDLNSKLEEALVLGNKEELVKRKKSLEADAAQLAMSSLAQKKTLARLLERSEIGFRMLAPLVVEAREEIEKLHNKGTIPRNFLPILKERIELGVCVCGNPLHENSEHRESVLKLIEEEMEREQSHVAERLTQLRHSDMSRHDDQDFEARWLVDYDSALNALGVNENQQIENGRDLRAIETQIDSIKDDKVPVLREMIGNWTRQHIEAHDRAIYSQQELGDLNTEVKARRNERDVSLEKVDDGQIALSNAAVVGDVEQIIQSAIELVRNDKVRSVSETMNGMFLSMIRSDPDSGLIRQAKISKDFDIEVLGPLDRQFTPDTDLNGASRRALTYSFILALTQESDFEAPVFVDTPLGMTAGVVRRNIVEVTAQSSRPTVLFLTRSEISGVEDLLDKHSGAFVTMTNMTHSDVVNRSGDSETIELCVCSHRQFCEICERDGDRADSVLELRSE